MSELKVVNTTCLFSVGCQLDLDHILTAIKNARRPKCKIGSRSRFSSVILRRKNCTALIYRSGKLVLTGCRGIAPARSTARSLAALFRRLGYLASYQSFRVTNIVGSMRLTSQLDLTSFAQVVGGSLEPELFPGLIYNTANNTKVSVFRNGKAYVTGCNSLRMLKKEANNFILLTATFLL